MHFVSLLLFAVTGVLYTAPAVASSPKGVYVSSPDRYAEWWRGGTYDATWTAEVDLTGDIPNVDLFLVPTDSIVAVGVLVGIVPVTDYQAQVTVPTDINPGTYWFVCGLDKDYLSDAFTIV